jgi:hypothetical protein
MAFLCMIFSRVLDIQLTWLSPARYQLQADGQILGDHRDLYRGLSRRHRQVLAAIYRLSFARHLFSVWHRGSLKILTDQWLVGFVVFVATTSLVSDFRQYGLSAKTIALAILILTATCLALGNITWTRAVCSWNVAAFRVRAKWRRRSSWAGLSGGRSTPISDPSPLN